MLFIFGAMLVVFYLILSLSKPRYAVIILLGLFALWPSYAAIILIPGSISIYPQRVGVLLLLFAWAIHVIKLGAVRARLAETIASNRLVFYLAIAYFLFGIISSGLTSPQVSKSMLAGINAFISYPLFMIFVMSYFFSRKHLIQLFFAIQLMAVLAELIGIIEWVNQGNIFALFIDPVSEIAEEMMSGKIRDGIYRIQGTFLNPLAFAEFLVLVLPISLYFVQQRKCGATIRIVSAIQMILGLACIYLTSSRTSIIIAVLLIVLSMLWVNWKKSNSVRFYVVLSGVGLLLALVIPSGALDTFIIGDDSAANSTDARLLQLEVGVPAVIRSPLLGYGLGQGALYVEPLTAIDNYYLTVSLETGLSGLLLLIIFQVRAFKLAVQAIHNPIIPSFGMFIAVAFLGVFINELTLSIIQPFTFLFAMVGALMVMQNSGKPTYFVARRIND